MAIAAVESQKMWKKQLCRHQGQWRRKGRRCSRRWSRDSPAAHGEDHGEAVCPPAACGGPWWSRDSPADYGGPTSEQVDAPEGGCGPVESPRWSRLLPGPVDLWREKPRLEQVCWQDLWPRGGPKLKHSVPEGLHPMGMTRAGAVHEELQPVGRTHVGEFRGELSPVGRTPSSGRVWGRRSSRDNMWWTDFNPHSTSSCTAGGEEVENWGVKLRLGRREGWGEGVLRFGFISHYSTLIWLVIN